MSRSRKLYLFPFEYKNSTALIFKSLLGSGVKPEQILYLTPSPRKLRATQVFLARMLGARAFIPPMFRTIGQLAREICDWTSDHRFFPDELKPLLIRRILRQRNRNVTIGYARVIGSFIADIKRHIPETERSRIPQILNQLLAGYEKPLNRALEAFMTMVEYDRQLYKQGWIDQEDVIQEATVKVNDFPLLPDVLILDCFVAPNRLEQEFISRLIEHSRITIASTYWSDTHPTEQYALAARFINFINQHEGFVTEQINVEVRNAEFPPVYRFPNPEQEVIGISRQIAARRSELNLAEVYVVLPWLALYAPLIERIFPQYQIPFTIFPKTTLASSPLILAVLELLRALNTDYERIATTAAFSSPYLPGLLRLSGDKDFKARARAANLLNLTSRRAGIIKGKDNWLNIAERIIVDEKSTKPEAENDLLYDLQTRVRQAIGLTESMLEPVGTVRNQARRLKQFLEAVGFGSNLDPEDEWFEQLNSDKKSLYDILDTIDDFEAEFGEQAEPRADFIRTLTYLLGIGTKAPEKEKGGVTVLEMEEILGINPQTLFFAGLNESELPGAYHPDPILPDSVRRQLNMPDIEWHRDWQKFHFWQVLNSSQEPPFLSFAESRDGKPNLLTPFINQQPVKYQDQEIIYSEVEEQLFQGRINNKLLDELVFNVDFTKDSRVKAELNRRFGPDYCFNVTMLESYRRCPYKFYINYVLNLETPEEPMFEIDARRWGIVAHHVLARLYQYGAVNLREFPHRANEIAKQVLNEINMPDFWRQVTEIVLNNLFTELTRTEAECQQKGFLPYRTEVLLQGEIKDIKIKGKIDRIDQCNNFVLVIDYKTGQIIPNPCEEVFKKNHLQLPLYSLLLQSSPDFKKYIIKDMGIYYLNDISIKWFAEKCSLDEVIKVATDNLLEIVDLIRAGKFTPVEVDKNKCRNCELNFTCGRNTANRD